MIPGKVLAAVVALGVLAALPRSEAASRETGKAAKPAPTPAERIAGRWRITLEGFSIEHEEILASFAVEGELLIGTLTVGRDMISIASGRAVGTSLAFSFTHAGGETFKMKGSASDRGLQGEWEARNEKGKWRAARMK